ncbi:acetaldehyde dehydrogenase (acetylating) [Oceanobacillus sojae]|uniref:Aldehyde dehydrogenase n=1 Tax=Oceanobacillus sojae TaxID=582851 RepID=A0A511ZFW7_9BACI|nr:acetaldehyde dehydrogenase (acetylating) [Oceanobacillus sojae]GEN86342.1 aldehyde dehydrogenase [Oceanobacillus sojae]
MTLDKDLSSIQEMRDAVKKAKKAQQEFMQFSQWKIDSIVKAIAAAAFNQSKELARMAVEETGMGVVEHKLIKNQVGSRDVYESIKDEKTIGVIHEDTENKVTEIAYPYGVIAAIIPTTNPTSTAMFKTIAALKSGNAIVVSPHPRAKKCTVETLKICMEAALEEGAPEGLIGWISEPSMEATNQLMTHPDVNLILSTGGGGLVKAAYSSGKPAYGVGPGNVPVYIEKSADVEKSVKMIVDSKTFDNGTICATEQAIVVDKAIQEQVKRELEKNGSYFCNPEVKKKMEEIISIGPGKVNPDIVGKSALKIAELAGINVPSNTRLLIAEEDQVGKHIPFSLEKLAPVFALYTAENSNEAKERCLELLNLGGRGHSFSIHTKDDHLVREFGKAMPVSRVLVNTLSSIGAVGATTALAPSLTLGCGAYGGNISSDNITARHLYNVKRIAYGLREADIPQPGESKSEAVSSKQVEHLMKEAVEKSGAASEEIDKVKIEELVRQVLKEYQNQ